MNLPLARPDDLESDRIALAATDFTPALRLIPPSSAPLALEKAEQTFGTPVKSVASLPAPESDALAELPVESEESLQENWLSVFPIAMFVLLASFAAITALT